MVLNDTTEDVFEALIPLLGISAFVLTVVMIAMVGYYLIKVRTETRQFKALLNFFIASNGLASKRILLIAAGEEKVSFVAMMNNIRYQYSGIQFTDLFSRKD